MSLLWMVIKPLQPLLETLFFRSLQSKSHAMKWAEHATRSAMVDDFHDIHKNIVEDFYKRVQYHPADLERIKSIQGPKVFVVRNFGRFEYAYFNYLFLKSSMDLAQWGQGISMLMLTPFKRLLALLPFGTRDIFS